MKVKANINVLIISLLLITGAAVYATGPGAEPGVSDTISPSLDAIYTAPTLTFVDSAELIPAYNTYCNWNESVHFNPWEALDFKDTVKVCLFDGHCGYVPPVVNKVNSNFGYRRGRPHFGIDIDLNTGDTVVAAFEGMVRVAKREGGYGNLVVIRHANGLETYYGHLSKIKVENGQWVDAGQLIGLGGSTGRSTGAHLHFETRYKGMPLNPNDIIDFASNKTTADVYTITSASFDYMRANKYARHHKYSSKTRNYAKAGGSIKTVIPKTSSPSKKVTSVTVKTTAGVSYHTIKSGDTIYSLAKKYGTTVEAICKINGIKPTTILKLGQRLRCE